MTPTLFTDASVLIAAAASPSGGSSAILELGRRKKVRLIASKLVLVEAERNIRDKLPEDVLLRFYEQLASIPVRLVRSATEAEIAKAEQIVATKDAHVVAAAGKARVDVLLTLDRKHLLVDSVRASVPFLIETPGDFLKRYLGDESS